MVSVLSPTVRLPLLAHVPPDTKTLLMLSRVAFTLVTRPPVTSSLPLTPRSPLLAHVPLDTVAVPTL